MACLTTCCLPIFELLCVAGFTRWAARRCLLHGSTSSEDWTPATAQEIKDIPRVCRVILGVYEDDIRKPVYADRLIVDQVIKNVDYNVTDGNCPPYLIYLDHEAKDVTLAIRGLNLINASDYTTLYKKGRQEYDGGYVHYGLFTAANWLLDKELDTLKTLLENYPDYTLTLAGHSLGSGIASLMTIILMNSKDKLGSISRNRIKCYGVAPARCTSLNLAVKYADNVKSIVLQDDFLPRTTMPLQIIFCSLFCLPCLLAISCCKETFVSEESKLQDPHRLFTPGRLYHIVYSEFCSCEELGPFVRTAIPVNGRFENIVCSMTSSDDHSLIQLEKRITQALQLLSETEVNVDDMEEEEKVVRHIALKKSHKNEHMQALEKAVSLGIHGAKTPEESFTLKNMSSDNLFAFASVPDDPPTSTSDSSSTNRGPVESPSLGKSTLGDWTRTGKQIEECENGDGKMLNEKVTNQIEEKDLSHGENDAGNSNNHGSEQPNDGDNSNKLGSNASLDLNSQPHFKVTDSVHQEDAIGELDERNVVFVDDHHDKITNGGINADKHV